MTTKLVRGEIVTCVANPKDAGSDAFVHIADGAILLDGGHIAAAEPFADLSARYPDAEVIDRSGHLITPGFIDTHIHFPQTDMIASYGEQLLDWLERYTFPTESTFSAADVCADTAAFFIDQLLANGTTSALVFGSVHRQSVDALFAEADKRQMRLIAGKAMMDQNVPESVRDTAASSDADNRGLIKRWHGKGRLGYAVTPRFAPACSSQQMLGAAKLLDEFPDLLMQTHMSENKAEIAWVKDLFPNAAHYLDVYASHGLLCDRSVFAHCIHLHDSEYEQLASAGASIAHCATSNLFLGSGLFDMARAEAAQITVGLGTDVGAGTSFSMLQTMAETYKVGQLRGNAICPEQLFYLATLGGARALKQGDRIGSLQAGYEADFLVLDPGATPLLARRLAKATDVTEKLFVLSVLGDERVVSETWVSGQRAFARG